MLLKKLPIHWNIVRLVGNPSGTVKPQLTKHNNPEKKRREVLKFKWLHSDDFKEKHQLIQDNRQEGTGEWLLISEDFINWKKGVSSRILLGLGIGKVKPSPELVN